MYYGLGCRVGETDERDGVAAVCCSNACFHIWMGVTQTVSAVTEQLAVLNDSPLTGGWACAGAPDPSHYNSLQVHPCMLLVFFFEVTAIGLTVEHGWQHLCVIFLFDFRA